MIMEQKKNYQPPQIKIVEIKRSSNLLAGTPDVVDVEIIDPPKP